MKPTLKILLLVFLSAVIATACGGQNVEPVLPEDADGQQEVETPNDDKQGNLDESNDKGIDEDEDEELPNDGEVDMTVSKIVTLYFADRELMGVFTEQREIETASEDSLPMAALQAWLDGPEHEELQNIVPPEVVIEYVELVDDIAYVSFSKEIRNANLGSAGELYLLEQLAMVMEQFGYEQTQILIEGEIIEYLLGHEDTSRPIEAKNPREYESIN